MINPPTRFAENHPKQYAYITATAITLLATAIITGLHLLVQNYCGGWENIFEKPFDLIIKLRDIHFSTIPEAMGVYTLIGMGSMLAGAAEGVLLISTFLALGSTPFCIATNYHNNKKIYNAYYKQTEGEIHKQAAKRALTTEGNFPDAIAQLTISFLPSS